MNPLWPSAAEERQMWLATRAEEWRKDELITPDQERAIEAAAAVPWKSNGSIAAAVFFVLTCLAVAFTYLLFDVLHMPGGLVTLIAIPAAEGLIVGKRWFGTGVESALWLAGLLAFIFSLPHSGKPEAMLVVAAAFLVSGVRMRNVFLDTGAAVLVVVYFGEKQWPDAALGAGIAIALVALIAIAREWSRPSATFLCEMLIVVMPLAAVLGGTMSVKLQIPLSWAVIYAVLAVAHFRVGVVLRQHAALIAGFLDLCIVYGILEVKHLLPYDAQTQSIIGGVLLLATATIIGRALRGRNRGITATATRVGELEEIVLLAGAAHVQHAKVKAAPSPQPAGGGTFGGAGATGDY